MNNSSREILRAIPSKMRVGDVVGLLTITEIDGGSARVKCACGARRTLYLSQLRRGYVSCGCSRRRGVYWPTPPSRGTP